MHVTPIRTSPVIDSGDISTFLDDFLPPIQERTIVVITSKIVSILEGSVEEKKDKQELIKREADYYIDENLWEKYHLYITRKESILIANSGIDESNANGKFI